MAIDDKRLAVSDKQNLKNKKVLITAGPTWVPIDDVRVISNIATGKTGVLLAEKLCRLGAKVTLLLGQFEGRCLNSHIKLARFKFFKELRNKIGAELKSKKYDIIIHSAAVSDFKPEKQSKGKLKSHKAYNLRLIPLPKIIAILNRLAPKARLVMFKLESKVSDKVLIKKAQKARLEMDAEFIVACKLNPYRAFIIDKEGNKILAKSRLELARKLPKILSMAG